jgi:hypothetical protein
MKKLVIISCLIAALIAGLVGGAVLAGSRPPASPVAGPVFMDGSSDILSIGYIPEDFPQFVSPQYPQMRHISVTIYVAGMTSGSPADDLAVRAYMGNNPLSPLEVPILRLSSCDQIGTIEFDATRWDIIGSDNDHSGNFTVYFSYTTTYPNPSTQNRQ